MTTHAKLPHSMSHRTGTVARRLLALCRVCCCVGLLLASPAQAALPQRFHQDQETEPFRGLVGASIGDIVWSGRYLWVGTEIGLARLDPSQGSGLNQRDWVTYTERNGIGRGGISALAAAGDVVWIATVFDTTIADRDFDVGAGLSFSFNAGQNWQHLPNEAILGDSHPSYLKKDLSG